MKIMKRFELGEPVIDCEVGDVLKTVDGKEVTCTEKYPIGGTTMYKVGDNYYNSYTLPGKFFTIRK